MRFALLGSGSEGNALVVQVGDAVFALRPGEAQMVTLEPMA